MLACSHTHTHSCTHTLAYTHTLVHAHTRTRTHRHLHTHAHARTHTHTDTRTRTKHIHTHITEGWRDCHRWSAVFTSVLSSRSAFLIIIIIIVVLMYFFPWIEFSYCICWFNCLLLQVNKPSASSKVFQIQKLITHHHCPPWLAHFCLYIGYWPGSSISLSAGCSLIRISCSTSPVVQCGLLAVLIALCNFWSCLFMLIIHIWFVKQLHIQAYAAKIFSAWYSVFTAYILTWTLTGRSRTVKLAAAALLLFLCREKPDRCKWRQLASTAAYTAMTPIGVVGV